MKYRYLTWVKFLATPPRAGNFTDWIRMINLNKKTHETQILSLLYIEASCFYTSIFFYSVMPFWGKVGVPYSDLTHTHYLLQIMENKVDSESTWNLLKFVFLFISVFRFWTILYTFVQLRIFKY